MLKVKFYDSIDDSLLEFAVIISQHNGKWVLCRHRERSTYEAPGGTRVSGEAILETAMRELYEETGALDFEISPVCIYSTIDPDKIGTNETFGMLYYADIKTFLPLPDFEIEEVLHFRDLPDNWTYPDIQPKLNDKIKMIILDN